MLLCKRSGNVVLKCPGPNKRPVEASGRSANFEDEINLVD